MYYSTSNNNSCCDSPSSFSSEYTKNKNFSTQIFKEENFNRLYESVIVETSTFDMTHVFELGIIFKIDHLSQ